MNFILNFINFNFILLILLILLILTIKKCLATSKNPMCLPCIRDFVNSQEGENLVCPYKCCIGYKSHKIYQTYGDYLRGTNEFPEMCMWTTLYNYGVLNTKCNLCEYSILFKPIPKNVEICKKFDFASKIKN